jgi:hypothetical protein
LTITLQFACFSTTTWPPLHSLYCAALLIPVIERLSMYGTDEERINKVLRDEKSAFPPFEQMEAAVGAKGHPRMNKETWQALNSFTHSGAQQLFSQVDGEGMIQANFDDDQLASCLHLASQHLQVIVAVHISMSGDERIAHEVVKEYYKLFGGVTSE